MAWTTLTMKVTTPLFNSGADSSDAGVRVASIRGAMRFWFRALAGTVAGPDLGLLAALERRVFGGVTRQGAVASPLVLRLPSPPRAWRDESFLQGNDGRWIGYLLGLGLMKPVRGGARLERPCVPPDGDPFELMVRFRHAPGETDAAQEAIESLAFASLWLACTYGGIGARTRRGLGGVSILDAPGPWRTPDAEFYQQVGCVWPRQADWTRLEEQLRDLAGNVDSWTGLPEYPVLSRTHSPATVVPRSFQSWQEALAYGGKQLRMFRANDPYDDERTRRKGQVRTGEWVDVIKGGMASFPLGALGLPVSFHNKKTKERFVVNAVAADGEPQRRASPLWIRAVGSGRSWRLLTFVMRSRFLPDGTKVHILPVSDDSDLDIEEEHVDDLTGQWLQVMGDGGSFVDVSNIRT